MSYLDESLAPGENIVARFDLPWTAKWRLIVFLLLAIPTLGIALLAALYEWIRLRSIEQGVTNRRVVRKTGIVSRQTEELLLASIETIDLRQTTWGRLLGYGNVVIRTDASGRQVRVSDVARVELGAADYNSNTYLSGKPTVVLGIFQRPGSNALAAAEKVKAEMDAMSAKFPKGLAYSVIWNPTDFIQQSVTAVMHTLLEAIVLVVLVIVVFLQKWRAAIIPVVGSRSR